MDRGQVRSEVRWLKGVPNGAPITVYLWSYRGHQGEAVNLAEAWRAIAEAADKAYFVGEGFVKHCPRCLGQCCLDDFGYKVVHMGAEHKWTQFVRKMAGDKPAEFMIKMFNQTRSQWIHDLMG